MIFPIHATYQRTPYLGLLFGTLTFFLIYFPGRKLATKFAISIFLIFGLLFFTINFTEVFESVNSFIQGSVRSESKFTDPKSFYDRLGIWFRSADVFIYSFPFGVGEGMSELYYNAQFVPKTMNSLIGTQSIGSYQNISGFHITKAHNVYLHFISEYNVLGFLVLFVFIKQIFKNFRRKMSAKSSLEYDAYQATVFAIIVGIGVMNLFDSVIRLYFLYGLLLFFTYSTPKNQRLFETLH